jgi:hypothetical protein
MNRRTLLKNLGYTVGATALTPSMLSMLQSCTQDPSWKPAIFPQNKIAFVNTLLDCILPKTDTPSASELNLIAFIDTYYDLARNKKDQERLLMGLEAFEKVSLKEHNKSSVDAITTEELEAELSKYLRGTNTKREQWDAALYRYLDAVNRNIESTDVPEVALAYDFAQALRNSAVQAYKTNEYIGEEVRPYAPIPGQQKGCVDLQETTGGKSWSL